MTAVATVFVMTVTARARQVMVVKIVHKAPARTIAMDLGCARAAFVSATAHIVVSIALLPSAQTTALDLGAAMWMEHACAFRHKLELTVPFANVPMTAMVMDSARTSPVSAAGSGPERIAVSALARVTATMRAGAIMACASATPASKSARMASAPFSVCIGRSTRRV